jgi:hypothetical protein
VKIKLQGVLGFWGFWGFVGYWVLVFGVSLCRCVAVLVYAVKDGATAMQETGGSDASVKT